MTALLDEVIGLVMQKVKVRESPALKMSQGN